jgi:hypothetical protein
MNEYVAFSGGVDSTALALLMPDACPIFTDTGWEFPHVYEHIKRFEQVTGRDVKRLKNKKYPSGIPEYIKHSAYLPSFGRRWCTVMFKIKPNEGFLQEGDTLLIGLRADEPGRVGNVGNYARYPLREMGLNRGDCVRICAENDLLPRHPVYAARGGCVGCFYKRKSEVIAMAALVPETFNSLVELEEAAQHPGKRYFCMFPNVGMSIREIQAQPMLFEPEQVYASAYDTSDYGPACGLFCNR